MSNLYAKSGVNIKKGSEVVARIKGHVASTHTKAVLKNIGSFGGLFELTDIIKKYKVHIIWGLVAIVMLGGGFVGGKLSATASRPGFGGGVGLSNVATHRTTEGMTQGGFTSGQIAEITSSSITLQLPNGSSKVVFYSGLTTISEPKVVSSSALTTGITIMVGGTQNSDGSLSAQTIEVGVAGAARGSSGGKAVSAPTGR